MGRPTLRIAPGAAPRWRILAAVCCTSLLLGSLAALGSARPVPIARSEASPLSSRVTGPDEGSSVVGQICLSLGSFLVENESCPDSGAPQSVEWDSSNGDLLISNGPSSGGGGLWVVSPVTGAVLTTLPGGTAFDGAAVDPANGNIYVPGGSSGASNVAVFAGTNFTIVAIIPVGTDPDAILFDPANGDVYVANAGSDNVSVIDSTTNQVIGSIPVGGGSAGPGDLTLDSETGHLYVTGDYNSATVVNVSTGRVVANVSLGTWPTGMAFDPANGELYVPNVGQDTLMVINGTTNRIVANISIYATWYSSGDDPVTAAFDPVNGNICVTNWFSPDIDVVPSSANALMAAVRASNFGWGIAFSPGGYGYAASYSNDTITVFTTPDSYPVRFNETGLPFGTNWTVNTIVLSGFFFSVTRTTDRNWITIPEPYGIFLLLVSANNSSTAHYVANPSRATLNETGAPLNVTIQFTLAPPTPAGSSAGIALAWGYGAAAAAGLVIIVAAVALIVRARRRDRGGRGGPGDPGGSNGAGPSPGDRGQAP